MWTVSSIRQLFNASAQSLDEHPIAQWNHGLHAHERRWKHDVGVSKTVVILKGVCVAISAAVLPMTLLTLMIVTDGTAPEDLEPYNYGGAFAIAACGTVIMPFIAVPIWRLLRRSLDYATLVFVLPVALLLAIVTLRVTVSNCFEVTVAC